MRVYSVHVDWLYRLNGSVNVFGDIVVTEVWFDHSGKEWAWGRKG